MVSMERMQSRKVSAISNKIAHIVRSRGTVSFGEMCIAADLTPSSLYNYKRVVLDLFNDITYDGEKFHAPKQEPEQKAEV